MKMKRVTPEELDKLLEGCEFEKYLDPTDERYELIVIRQPRIDLTGGPAFEDESWAGMDAMNRTNGFGFTRASGALNALGMSELSLQVLRAGVALNLVEPFEDSDIAKANESIAYYGPRKTEDGT